MTEIRLRQRWFWQRLARHYREYRRLEMTPVEALRFAWHLTWMKDIVC